MRHKSGSRWLARLMLLFYSKKGFVTITTYNYEWIDAYITSVFVVSGTFGTNYHKAIDGRLIQYEGSAEVDPKKFSLDVWGYGDGECIVYREAEGEIPPYCAARYTEYLMGKHKEVKLLLIDRDEQLKNRKILRKTRDELNKCNDMEKIKACANILGNILGV